MSTLTQIFSQDLFTKVAFILGFVSATISVVPAIGRVWLGRVVATKKLSAAKEAEFKHALSSDKIAIVGEYLDSRLGPFTIYEYTTDKVVEERVNAILSKLAEFVGAEDQAERLTPGASTVDIDVNTDIRFRRSPTPPVGQSDVQLIGFDSVASALEEGEIWDGLARLRRLIEIRLRNLAIAQGIKERHLKSAGQILRLLTNHRALPPEATRRLAEVIRVCNEGVHGYEVPIDRAWDAYATAREVLPSE